MSTSNNCRGSNHWSIIRHMNKYMEKGGPSQLLNIGFYSLSYLKQTCSKWDLQSSQTRPVDAWQLTSGQRSPKHPFWRNSFTCWMMWIQSQLLPSIHHIFWVVCTLTQKTYSCISLPTPCSFPKHNHLVQNHAKRVLGVTTYGDPSQHNTATLLSPFVVLVV